MTEPEASSQPEPLVQPGPLAQREPPSETPGGPPASRASLAWYWFARWVVEIVSRLMWSVEVRGRDNVPTSGVFVLAPVHRSNIDTLIAGCVVRRRIRFMGKDSMWKHKVVGAFLSSLGAFPVTRGTPDREALKDCEEALAGGEPVVLFPEGTRKAGPVVEKIFEGAVFVAARAGVPIVPVGIGGSEYAMPKGSKMIHRTKVVAVVGKAIFPPERSASGRVPRKAIGALADQLKVELQELFDQAMVAAGRGDEVVGSEPSA